MSDYTPPVSGLLKLGRPEFPQSTTDYKALGFDASHVPQLLRLLRDDELIYGEEDAPEVYAQIHAWRALGQLRAPEAIEPLLDLLDEQESEEWNDWITEEVPATLGLFGPVVIPAAVARLERRGQQEHAPCYHANVLVEVAKLFPETRAEVISHLSAVLSTTTANNPALNGFIIADLTDMEAVEAWPTIESAFATGNVDESIAGDAAEVKFQLGLGPEPPRPRPWGLASRSPSTSPRSGLNAKQRFNERQRKKKAEKKKNKKKRKG